MSFRCVSDDHFPTKSRAGERSPGSSHLHTRDPPAEEQSEQFAAAKPGDTHTGRTELLQSFVHCTLDRIQIPFETRSDVEWLHFICRFAHNRKEDYWPLLSFSQ